MLLDELEELFDGLRRRQLDGATAHLVDGIELGGVIEQFVATRSRRTQVDGGEYAAVRERAVQHDLAVARPLELLEDQIVHARSRLDERGREDRHRSSILHVSRHAEELTRDLE